MADWIPISPRQSIQPQQSIENNNPPEPTQREQMQVKVSAHRHELSHAPQSAPPSPRGRASIVIAPQGGEDVSTKKGKLSRLAGAVKGLLGKIGLGRSPKKEVTAEPLPMTGSSDKFLPLGAPNPHSENNAKINKKITELEGKIHATLDKCVSKGKMSKNEKKELLKDLSAIHGLQSQKAMPGVSYSKTKEETALLGPIQTKLEKIGGSLNELFGEESVESNSILKYLSKGKETLENHVKLFEGQEKDNVFKESSAEQIAQHLKTTGDSTEPMNTMVYKRDVSFDGLPDKELFGEGLLPNANTQEGKHRLPLDSIRSGSIKFGSADNKVVLNAGSASVQNIGKSARNEDRADFGTIIVGNVAIPYGAVFDGHGGNQVADYLASHFKEALGAALASYPQPLSDESIFNGLQKACIETNKTLREEYAPTAGSCATISIVVNDALWVANVGDSRAIVVGDKISCLTQDAELNRAGFKEYADELHAIPTPDGRLAPAGGGQGRIETPRAFGDCNTPGISAHPMISKVPLSECGDPAHLVIVCDGGVASASNQEVGNAAKALLEQGILPSKVAENLAIKSSNADVHYNAEIVAKHTKSEETLAKAKARLEESKGHLKQADAKVQEAQVNLDEATKLYNLALEKKINKLGQTEYLQKAKETAQSELDSAIAMQKALESPAGKKALADEIAQREKDVKDATAVFADLEKAKRKKAGDDITYVVIALPTGKKGA